MQLFTRNGLALLLGTTLFSTGCVSNKYQAASALSAQPNRMDLELGSTPLKTRLDSVIVYQGQGSWKLAAYWDEVMLTMANEGDEPINLNAVSLVDYAGTLVPAGSDPWQLELASRTQRDRYTASGVNFALNTLGYVSFTYGATGAGFFVGAALTSSWGGATTGAVLGLAAVPVTAIAVYANNQKHKRAIEHEFNRRRLALPLTVPTHAARSGSFFFPMTVSPQALRLEWSRGPASGVSLLPLPMLAGMHRDARSAPNTSKP